MDTSGLVIPVKRCIVIRENGSTCVWAVASFLKRSTSRESGRVALEVAYVSLVPFFEMANSVDRREREEVCIMQGTSRDVARERRRRRKAEDGTGS